jgi:N-acetylmuramic acid 6-phosphate etherase
MSNLQARNQKLRERAARILAAETGLDESAAAKVLAAAEGDLRVAAVMIATSSDLDAAKRALIESNQVVSKAIKNLQTL